jgi:hypothetical protein
MQAMILRRRCGKGMTRLGRDRRGRRGRLRDQAIRLVTMADDECPVSGVACQYLTPMSGTADAHCAVDHWWALPWWIAA